MSAELPAVNAPADGRRPHWLRLAIWCAAVVAFCAGAALSPLAWTGLKRVRERWERERAWNAERVSVTIRDRPIWESTWQLKCPEGGGVMLLPGVDRTARVTADLQDVPRLVAYRRVLRLAGADCLVERGNKLVIFAPRSAEWQRCRSPALLWGPPSEVSDDVRRKFQKDCTFEFADAPIGECLEYVTRVTGDVPVVWDTPMPEQFVTLEGIFVTPELVLDYTLRLSGLVGEVRDGAIHIRRAP